MERLQRNMAIRQEAEWKRFREEILMPLYIKVAGGDEKNAKTLADCLKICQEGERKAFLFGGDEVEAGPLQVCFEDGEC